MILLITAGISWLAALILLICGPLIPVFMALIGTRAKSASAGQQDKLTRLSGLLLDRIRGLETLKLFGAVGRTEDDIRQSGEAFRLGTMKVLKIAFLSSTVLELFSALGIAFVAVYVGFSLLGDISMGTWGGPLDYWQGLFVLLLAPEFFAPLRGYAAANHDRAAGLAAQDKLADIAAEMTKGAAGNPDGTSATEEPVRNGETSTQSAPPAILLKHVCLVLGKKPVLDNLSLDIASGETVLLRGASGSGKTTLLDTLLGFQSPQSGLIEIDGRALTDGRAVVLRETVAWLGQAPRLFHGTVRHNLLKGNIGSEAIAEEDVWQALRLAGADNLVKRLPDGLATPLGEEGFGLSVGEIRRIALARAALRKDALLVLADEPTAGLDAETAVDVIAGLKTLCKDKTAIIATHDPALSAVPGRVVKMTALRSSPSVEARV